jgi:perosamine synthetase
LADFIPYGRQSIDSQDIQAVVEVLGSDWLTTGPAVDAFEKAFAQAAGTSHAVAVSNGTAALHAALHAAGVGPGDEVVVPPMTFAATANAVLYCGAKPVFCDVRPDDLLLDPALVEARITPRTRAILAVDYAGHPCDYDALRAIADANGLKLLADACHAVGGSYRQRPVGSLADFSTFSFHPVKHMTTGEGGMITTQDAQAAATMRAFRNHGITTDHRQRAHKGTWFYEMVELGFNYRITDMQCALGLSQLSRLPDWIRRRREIATWYNEFFAGCESIQPLAVCGQVEHAYHLYVVRLEGAAARNRSEVFDAMRAAGIGVNVHYIPVHMHPYYRKNLQTAPGQCPVAEQAYGQILSLPMYPGLSKGDVDRVCGSLMQAVGSSR